MAECTDYLEETLNEKCSTLENEIAEFKRLNGVANDEIIKLREQLQEMEKENESKTKISTEKEQSLEEKCSILENEKSESQKKFAEVNQKNEKLIAELQLKMDKLEADKQSLIEKILAVESVENEKVPDKMIDEKFVEELNQKYAALEIKAAETERSLKIASNEIINLKEKLNSAEMNEKLNALEEEKEKLNEKYEDEKNSAISKSALLIQQNIQHSEEKKIWITIFNDFCVKMNLLKNENVKLFGELKYYREAFSSGNDEVVVPTKCKRKSLDPQQKQVQQQQPNIASNNNGIQFSALESFASNNPGSSTQ